MPSHLICLRCYNQSVIRYLLIFIILWNCKRHPPPLLISARDRMTLETLILAGSTHDNKNFVTSREQDLIEMRQDLVYMYGEGKTPDAKSIEIVIDQNIRNELLSSPSDYIEQKTHEIFQIAGSGTSLSLDGCLSYHRLQTEWRTARDAKQVTRQTTGTQALKDCLQKGLGLKGENLFSKHSACLQTAIGEENPIQTLSRTPSVSSDAEYEQACQEIFSAPFLRRLQAPVSDRLAENSLEPLIKSLVQFSEENQNLKNKILFLQDFRRRLVQNLRGYFEGYSKCMVAIPQKEQVQKCLKSTRTVFKEMP